MSPKEAPGIKPTHFKQSDQSVEDIVGNSKLKAKIALGLGGIFCAACTAALADGFPNDPEARNLVQQGGAYLKSNDFTHAREVLEKALRIEPSSGLVRFRLARSYAGLGNNEGALQEYFASLQLKPHIPVTLYNIGDCYQSLGDLDKARQWLEKYIKEEPGDSLVPLARQRVEALTRVAAKYKASNKDGPDYFESLIGDKGPEKWPRSKMPIKVFIHAGDNIPGFPKEYPAILYESLQAWGQAVGSRIGFVVVPNADQSDIYCDWTADAKELKKNATGAEAGHTDVEWAMSRTDPTRTRNLEKARVRILVTDPKGSPVEFNAIRKTCLHELGHALGLDGHSGNPHDIMFFGESTAGLPALSKRDKATIQRLYSD